MKKQLSVILIITAITIILIPSLRAEYYYSHRGQIELVKCDSIVSVKFHPEVPQTQAETFAYEVECLDEDYLPVESGNDFVIYHLNTQFTVDTAIYILLNMSPVLFAFPLFKGNFEGADVIPACDNFILSFNDSVAQSTIDSLYEYYNLEQLEGPLTYTGTRLVVLTSQSMGHTLEIANAIYETGLVRFSEPHVAVPQLADFIPDDPLYDYQYYLNNTEFPEIDIDIQPAWEISKGSTDVVIFIIDAGCDDVHEDINFDNVMWEQGYDYVGDPCLNYNDPPYPDPDANPGYRSAHGVACQGIITAELNNNTGVSGVAPKCRMIPLKIFDDCGYGRQSSIPVENAIRQVVDYVRNYYHPDPVVVNCSWAYHWSYPCPAGVVALLDTAASWNIPFVFASGNQGEKFPIGTYIAEPAGLSSTIAVGAIKKNGEHWSYSGCGPDLDVVAPSGWKTILDGDVYTIDRMGEAGWNPYLETCENTNANYMCFFGGTSGAAPQVTGILALIRSRRPDINSLDTFRMIINNSAVDGIGDEYDTPGWDIVYGHGLANACRALLSVSRGDANNDGIINVLDITYINAFLYKGGPPPQPDTLMGDANCYCSVHNPDEVCVNLLDMTYLIQYLYKNGPPPPVCFEYND